MLFRSPACAVALRPSGTHIYDELLQTLNSHSPDKPDIYIMRTIALAYSGGLDTSIIVPWLREHYDARVICVAADIGQGDELEGVKQKAIASGAAECYVEDLRQEYVRDYIWPTLRAGAIYNRKYLLDRKSTRLNSSHMSESRMPSSA